MHFRFPKLYFVICPYFRYLTEKQKALITAYAELDDDIKGTVTGAEKRKDGKCIIRIK